MGEKRRLVLAQLIAFQSLARQQSHVSLNLLGFDEPFDILDRKGCEKAAAIIQELGRDNAIIIATHRQEFRSFFNNVVTVAKKADDFSALRKS